MKRDFKEALENRRSCYNLDNKVSISDNEIKDILNFAVKHVPSAFNSQSTRVVLLLGDHHKKLWNIVKETLRKLVSAETFKSTEAKVDGAFLSGYGTVLFFEDEQVIKSLQESLPDYKNNFPILSQQTSAMHQLAIWTMLEDAGLGASLQHYNPLIDDEVKRTWKLDSNWKLIAQMPFGNPTAKPGKKEYKPLEGRVKFFE